MILNLCFLCFLWNKSVKKYPLLQLNNNKRLNIINNKFFIANKKTTGIFSRRLIHDLLSQLIKFNKQILNRKQGNSVRIMGGFVWLIRSFPSV